MYMLYVLNVILYLSILQPAIVYEMHLSILCAVLTSAYIQSAPATTTNIYIAGKWYTLHCNTIMIPHQHQIDQLFVNVMFMFTSGDSNYFFNSTGRYFRCIFFSFIRNIHRLLHPFSLCILNGVFRLPLQSLEGSNLILAYIWKTKTSVHDSYFWLFRCSLTTSIFQSKKLVICFLPLSFL